MYVYRVCKGNIILLARSKRFLAKHVHVHTRACWGIVYIQKGQRPSWCTSFWTRELHHYTIQHAAHNHLNLLQILWIAHWYYMNIAAVHSINTDYVQFNRFYTYSEALLNQRTSTTYVYYMTSLIRAAFRSSCKGVIKHFQGAKYVCKGGIKYC